MTLYPQQEPGPAGRQSQGAETEIDLNTLWRGVRRHLAWILLTAAVLALGAYLWSRTQPPVYEASSSLIAANGQGQDGPFGNALVKAPPLPEGAVAQAMQSTLVIVPLIQALQGDETIPQAERTRLAQALSRELREQRLRTITLTSQLDLSGNGIYTLRARARSAQAAQRLANLASAALLNWDRSRALENIRRAQAGFQAQLAQIDQQLRQGNLPAVERQTLIARRATVQENLAQVGILENSATGVLSLLSNAVEPSRPVAPKPLRNAVLAALLGLLLATGVVALLTILDRTVRSEDDLLALNAPTLAVIPRLRQRDIVFSGIVRAARQAGLYEAIGFLRVNLMTAFGNKPHPVVMITSTAPGEGKSSLTATLADGFASSGQRVLIIDADLRRGTQAAVWKKYDEGGQWHQLTGQGGARTTREALANPQNVQVLQVEDNVDMLPAGPGVQDSLAIFNQADIETALRLWRQNYDIVLMDSAPLLALADGLVLGGHADAVLMVTEYGRTNVQSVRSALRRAERAGLNLIGFVINKSDVREGSSYGYSYSYAPRAGGVKV
ncbi:succinoglycan biosynthesis protein exop [Deinococcus metallilatus]|uniref:Non-specific protein-tyrosine kinase n=1 Tax=Deinococcus metallilatus TaxID=1211322 RepID=A0AAJ5JXL2_9DEIO|nr:AAA family ATPase [Deinococcus metallilatus]MBB5297043.1 non-specific protein-tyrosine kinase [Deinococcus metallilatus]QBY07828.1 succinoglycan biosynthesis protein exop [Deinococcus metallilatus]RXJ13177.1 succinoglycan biosynthesis protein exop [Deinococcus metallilatus]TLK23050.1 succinoglycan biosynthesis protein exop [Deinococcus metallilatus]GMA16009.1 exoP [Deinococcus metallilatus]